MLVAEIIVKGGVDKPLKKIVEKLYYKSKELIVKNSINQHYMDEINVLRRQLEEQGQTARKLLTENDTLRKTIKSQCDTIQYSPSKFIPSNSFKEDRFATRLAPFLKLFQSLIKDEDTSSLHFNMLSHFKQSLHCDTVLVLSRKSETQCEGEVHGKKVALKSMERFLSSSGPVVVNVVSAEDEVAHKVQAANMCVVRNYLVVPRKSHKENLASELLVFVNKKEGKNSMGVFCKSDEALGSLACCVYFMIEKYYKMMNKLRELRDAKKEAFDTIYELLCFVRFH